MILVIWVRGKITHALVEWCTKQADIGKGRYNHCGHSIGPVIVAPLIASFAHSGATIRGLLDIHYRLSPLEPCRMLSLQAYLVTNVTVFGFVQNIMIQPSHGS